MIGRKLEKKILYGGSGGSPPEKILQIGIKKVPFEQEKIATPLLEYEKKIRPPSFHGKKNFNPPTLISRPPSR